MGKFEDKLKKTDKLIMSFKRIVKDYPNGNYERIVDKLETQRAEHASTIGKNKAP